jgi:hypothetical protein
MRGKESEGRSDKSEETLARPKIMVDEILTTFARLHFLFPLSLENYSAKNVTKKTTDKT